MPRPKVSACVKSLCQLQRSAEAEILGLPKSHMNRSSHGRKSLIELALADVIEQTTASGPSLAAICCNRLAMSSSASSQVTRCHPGSAEDFGCVRRMG